MSEPRTTAARSGPAVRPGDDDTGPLTPRTWRLAWQDALYGPAGFYRRAEGPAGHFTTSTHGPLGPVFAEAVATMADREQCGLVVDVGAGRGELLGHLSRLRPDLRLLGVDVVDRPAGLPAVADWLVAPGGPSLPPALDHLDGALVIAHEWLDVVPCTIAEVDSEGTLREVCVDPGGGQSLGDPVGAGELAWAARWWPGAQPGDRVEIGDTRDEAWADLVGRVDRGVLVAVDYGQTGEASPRETFTAYRSGVQTTPMPDGSCDLTAHVLMGSVRHDELLRQADAVRRLGLGSSRPPHELSRTDPAAYLHALARASAVAALTDPGGLGGFLWAIVRVSGNQSEPSSV